MKESRLNKLLLRDFQGGSFSFETDGKDAFVFGMNASGKTRLVSAFMWLFFNKDALGRAEFEIKNLDAQGEAAHGLEHTVEADIILDRSSVNLKKVYRERWQKKRGSANREFTGHSTDYFIDGVPVQEKDYNARIAEMTGDESRFRLLTSPSVFPALHWQKQRALLLEICGDISDLDIIESDPKLKSLTEILGKRTLDDHRKIVIARRSEINKEMERIPVRIDEVRRTYGDSGTQARDHRDRSRGIPDVADLNRAALEQESKHIEAALNDAKLRLQGVNTGGNIADLTKKLSGLNADLHKMEDAHRSESLSALNRLNQQLSDAGVQAGASRRRIQAIDGELTAKNKSLQTMETALINLRDKWTAVDRETFQDTTTDTCPTCNQSLPSGQVQAARDKALASFNVDKAERLGEIDRKGKDLKEQRNQLSAEIEGLNGERERLRLSQSKEEEKLKSLTDERDALKGSAEDFSGIEGRADLLDEIEAINGEIEEERKGKAQDIERIKEEIEAHGLILSASKENLNKFVRKEQGDKRIEELKAEEKKLSAEYEKLESEIYLMEQFIKAKVALLTDRINSKFEMVRFKLFSQLINGGIEDCCEITVGGVPFNAGLNNAARIQAGLDIIRTLQEHFGMKAPIFIDNREAVTEIPKMSTQVISLVVSPEDKTLRVETERPKKTRQPRFEFQASGKQL